MTEKEYLEEQLNKIQQNRKPAFIYSPSEKERLSNSQIERQNAKRPNFRHHDDDAR